MGAAATESESAGAGWARRTESESAGAGRARRTESVSAGATEIERHDGRTDGAGLVEATLSSAATMTSAAAAGIRSIRRSARFRLPGEKRGTYLRLKLCSTGRPRSANSRRHCQKRADNYVWSLS
ncbi:MAG: hypothetical protein BRD45_06465 [Bacteroidetes bacterium QS_8_64_10]|nr:MAG: hypothetical protein BRD45_06465 [Bacteroidetes bacterium QS_8_64_10]